MTSFDKIFNNDNLNKIIEKLIINLLSIKIASIKKKQIDYSEIRKAVWLVSVLANSENEKHLKKVQDFTILLFLNNQNNVEILKVVYILFSRIGNLAATKHLKNLKNTEEGGIFNEDFVLMQELLNKQIENSIVVNEQVYLLTDFQKKLFEKIKNEKYISISAPTSSGKSFVLKKFIEEELKISEKYCVFYIVPSRALINQVSEELRVDIPNVTIKNAFIENENNQENKLIYVITPERAVNVINSEKGLSLPNLIFIDEIQNVENEDGRGNLFEYVYEELSKNESTKIITAGPFISNSNEVFKELFDKSSDIVKTNLSPVFQLRTIIRLHYDSISLKLFINNKVTYKLKNILTIDKIETIFNNNIGNGLSKIISALSKQNESNLVYASRGDYAEIWARKYSENITIENDLDNELVDLIKYVKTDIHPKYYLVSCLEKKIAFHSSNLSEFVRKEIETLFEQGIIKTLFCTSTLLEGVNLPADNLFIVKPEKNKEELSDFEFGNLIGRVGRIKHTLFGTIYCVSKNNNIEWAETYYKANYSKDVKTSSSRALPEINYEDILESSTNIESTKIKNIVISLRNKALRNDDSLEKFLDKHDIKEDSKEKIINKLEQSIKNVTIPYEIVKCNPTIDPLLQDELYKRVVENIENWVIHPNSNFNRVHKREMAENFEYKEKNFFWQLDSIIVELNKIFKITDELWKKDNLSISPTGICFNTMQWIQGNSIGKIISDRIKYFSEDERVHHSKRIDATNPEDINKIIKETNKIFLKVITFSFLKYLKLLVDILDNVLSDTQKEKYKLTLALPIQVELGTQEPIVISLISKGIPRTIALRVFEIFKRTNEYRNEIQIFDWLKSHNQINGLETIYNKFLIKNNYLNVNLESFRTLK